MREFLFLYLFLFSLVFVLLIVHADFDDFLNSVLNLFFKFNKRPKWVVKNAPLLSLLIPINLLNRS